LLPPDQADPPASPAARKQQVKIVELLT